MLLPSRPLNFIILNPSPIAARLVGRIGRRLAFVATAATGRSPIANEGNICAAIYQANRSLKK